jgi:transposase
LSALAAHRRRLVGEKSGLASQIDTIDEPVVRDMIDARMRMIAHDVAALDKAVRDLLAATPRLNQRHKRLCQVGGVGPIFATALLADLPEPGQISPRVAAALISVAPHARQSGASHRPGRCSGGRKHLRDIAYRGALSAIKADDPVLEPFYKRLRSKGKPFKLAMVATIRKLITFLNAIARSDPACA